MSHIIGLADKPHIDTLDSHTQCSPRDNNIRKDNLKYSLSVKNDDNQGENVTYGLCNQFQSEYIHSNMPNRCYSPKCIPALHFHIAQCKWHLIQALWRTKWMSWKRNVFWNLRTVEISIGLEILGQRVVGRPTKYRGEPRYKNWYHYLSRK